MRPSIAAQPDRGGGAQRGARACPMRRCSRSGRCTTSDRPGSSAVAARPARGSARRATGPSAAPVDAFDAKADALAVLARSARRRPAAGRGRARRPGITPAARARCKLGPRPCWPSSARSTRACCGARRQRPGRRPSRCSSSGAAAEGARRARPAAARAVAVPAGRARLRLRGRRGGRGRASWSAPRAGADRALIAGARVFDVYDGKGVPEGKKSVAIEVTLQPRERTLTDAEIEAVSNKIVAQVVKATGAVLRG